MKFEVGQTVFVVHQQRRQYGQHSSATPPRTEETAIVKIGRKYGYLASGFHEVAFCLETGASHHPGDCNARANNFGFDVFESEETWQIYTTAKSEYTRLQERLRTPGGIIAMTPVAVAAIHEILDTLE